MPKKILIIDDDTDLCLLLSKFLKKNGYEVDTAFSGNKGLAKYKSENFDAVISDYRLGDMNGSELIEKLKQVDNKAIILIITGYSDIRHAIEVIRLGAYDYIPKPLIPEEVLSILKQMTTDNIVNQRKNMVEGGTVLQDDSNAGQYFIGSSASTTSLYQQVEVVAPTNYSVILYGESGTGKEVVARTIHNRSKRSKYPFVAIDCGTLSRELAASELFGHVKGAFTGALLDKVGHIELANRGTLFLDEISNLSLDTQAVLLRTIQERIFKRVGCNKEIACDIRIIVASNENIKSAYQQGKFREDLYHRLNEFAISLPPLRERKDDIIPLAEYFLEKSCIENGKRVTGFTDAVIGAFRSYHWHGNLRELRNVVRRAVLLTHDEGIIDMTALLPEISENALASPTVHSHAQETYPAQNSVVLLKEASFNAEYQAIMSVLRTVNFNKKRAAEILKIDRKTLYNKLKLFKGVSDLPVLKR